MKIRGASTKVTKITTGRILLSESFIYHSHKTANARLRGWQRITTKLKHNNRNHRGSMGLETPCVDSPS
ncbi:hypothetical protein FLL77_10710 [Vibrio cholerae]|nr:hypothetical protein FLL77_10710 [Vibrio cholerae]